MKNFADTEKIKIESELERRSLESTVARKEAEARKASADARIQELKALEAELEFVEKLRRSGVVLCKDARGNVTALPAPAKVDFFEVQQRVIQAHIGKQQVVQNPRTRSRAGNSRQGCGYYCGRYSFVDVRPASKGRTWLDSQCDNGDPPQCKDPCQ